LFLRGNPCAIVRSALCRPSDGQVGAFVHQPDISVGGNDPISGGLGKARPSEAVLWMKSRTLAKVTGPHHAEMGLKLAERGGKNATKRAVVAVARKLAVLLHRLWLNGEVFEPLRNSQKAMRAVASRVAIRTVELNRRVQVIATKSWRPTPTASVRREGDNQVAAPTKTRTPT
jgi:hypothetical protein